MSILEQGSLEADLRELAEEVVRQCGVELVEMRLLRGGSRWTLRLDIDRAGVPGVGIEDCQSVSRALEAVLDERDSIPGRYTLEVSSPGLDRPIRSAEDVRRNCGRAVTVEARDENGEAVRVDGVLLDLDGNHLRIRDPETDQVTRIAWERITRAHQQIPF